jgi:hypothetical protein
MPTLGGPFASLSNLFDPSFAQQQPAHRHVEHRRQLFELLHADWERVLGDPSADVRCSFPQAAGEFRLTLDTHDLHPVSDTTPKALKA